MGNDIIPLASGIGSTLADVCGRVLRHRWVHGREAAANADMSHAARSPKYSRPA